MKYRLFTRQHCPDCPAAKELLAARFGAGEAVDCDTPAGLAEAVAEKVRATPVAIFYDELGKETGRACGLKEIKRVTAR